MKIDNGSEIRYFIFCYAKCLLLLLRDNFLKEKMLPTCLTKAFEFLVWAWGDDEGS